MSEFEEKRDKTKAFKASQASVNAINEIIKKSGKNDIEFFEELVHELSIKGLTDEGNESISVDLRRHFESDVQKLKNATNSILSIFVSQMENISVEKNQWQEVSGKQLHDKQEELDAQVAQYNELKEEASIANQTVVELEKVSDSLSKERDVLEKRTLDQEQLIQSVNERRQLLAERLDKLNEIIVEKDERLQKVSSIVEENKILVETKISLQSDIEKLNQRYKEELTKTKERLEFACEKEKHKAEMELLATFQKEKEEVRIETRKETELSIREFYMGEIERKEKEFAAKEESYKIQIAKLQEDDSVQ